MSFNNDDEPVKILNYGPGRMSTGSESMDPEKRITVETKQFYPDWDYGAEDEPPRFGVLYPDLPGELGRTTTSSD